MIVELKVDDEDEKKVVVNLIINNGYKVWMDKKPNGYAEDHFICFNYPIEGKER